MHGKDKRGEFKRERRKNKNRDKESPETLLTSPTI